MESLKWEKGCRIIRSAVQPEWLAVFGHEKEASKNNCGAECAVRSNFSSRGLAHGAWPVQSVSREGHAACLIPAEGASIFVFNIYYSWIEEIKMAEGKGVFLLFGLKVVLDPTGNCQLYCLCVLLNYFWRSALTASFTFSILNSWTFHSSLIFF